MFSSRRLSYCSQCMAVATLILIIAMLLLNAASWLYPTFYSVQQGTSNFNFGLNNDLVRHLHIDIASFPGWQKWGGIILSTLPLFALAASLFCLRALFKSYGRGEYFSSISANHLGKVARFVGLWVGLKIVCEPLLSMWITLHAPAGHRVITLSISGSDIVALFLAGSIGIIAHILQKASKLNAENQQFV